ncbi:MAG: hypothetical protein ACE5HF_02770 [Gemmatimonadota bacterium]
MSEHLSREQIAALLDEMNGGAAGSAHLARCAACSREYEQMSRMRMALSALSDLEPPVGQWEQIEASLERVASAPSGRGDDDRGRAGNRVLPFPVLGRWPLQAAAVLTLFAGGWLVGRTIGFQGAEAEAGRAAVTQMTDAPAESSELDFGRGPEADYLRTAADLADLRERAVGDGGSLTGPEAMTERIAKLDVLAELTRRALEEAPADPVLNNFLFDVMDERESLAEGLTRMLQTTAVEYR